LFWRGVFSLSGGIGEDILRNLFSSKDFLREQVKAENEVGWIKRLQSRAKKGLTENLLSNGALLWWSAAFLDGLLSLVRHGLGVFSSGAGREDVR
jgi:hypothetical protein